MRSKALELWVMAVSFRRALEHSAREQAFSPERDQTLGVEVLRMKCPEAHPAPNNQIQVSRPLQRLLAVKGTKKSAVPLKRISNL